MPGLATVRSNILDDINRGTDASARVTRALRDAIYFHRAERFTWNQKRKSFLISSEYTSLTANWIEIDSLTLQRAGNEVDALCEKPWKWINWRRRSSNDSSEPIYYAIQHDAAGPQLRVYPAPDRTYSVEMAYHFDLVAGIDSLSDSFSTGWLTTGEQMIRLQAQGDVLINYIKGPEAVADGNLCLEQSQAIYKQLRRRKNRADSSGSIQPWI